MLREHASAHVARTVLPRMPCQLNHELVSSVAGIVPRVAGLIPYKHNRHVQGWRCEEERARSLQQRSVKWGSPRHPHAALIP